MKGRLNTKSVTERPLELWIIPHHQSLVARGELYHDSGDSIQLAKSIQFHWTTCNLVILVPVQQQQQQIPTIRITSIRIALLAYQKNRVENSKLDVYSNDESVKWNILVKENPKHLLLEGSIELTKLAKPVVIRVEDKQTKECLFLPYS